MQDAARRDATHSRASKQNVGGLPRDCRLRRRSEYDAVYREGKRRSNSEFTVFFRSNGLEHSRFGWSIKKAVGTAVLRNRIRRRLREIVRLHHREIHHGWDIVIHPRTSAAKREFSQLTAELLKLLPLS